MNLFNLHCRGATGYVAKPNIAEAESFPEAPPDMWRSQISQKPRAMQVYLQLPRRHRINDEVKYTQKPRAMQMNLFNLHCRGATGYVAAGQISQKPRAFPRRYICGEAKYQPRYRRGAKSLTTAWASFIYHGRRSQVSRHISSHSLRSSWKIFLFLTAVSSLNI